MKRLLIPLLTVMMLFTFGSIALAQGKPVIELEPLEVAKPAIEPEEAPVLEDMLILQTAVGVPDTLTVTLSIDDNDIAVVQGDHILYSEAFPENQKSILKIRIKGSGRLCGARFDFEPYWEMPMEPAEPQPAQEPIPEPGLTDEPNVDPNNHPAGEQGMEPPIVDGDDNPAEPEPIIGDNAVENRTDSGGLNPAEDCNEAPESDGTTEPPADEDATEGETVTDPADEFVPDTPTDDAEGDSTALNFISRAFSPVLK